MAATDTLVLYPISRRGHIISMIEFGKLIQNHHPEFSIAVVIFTRPPDNTSDDLRATYPSIKFHYLPPTTAVDSGRSSFILARQNNQSLDTVLSAISKSTNLRALVIDFFNVPAIGVASRLNIPTYCYFTSGANGLITILHLPTLSKNIQSLKELGRQRLKIPGLPLIAASDFPTLFSDRNSPSYQDGLEIAECLTKTSGIIINTCESLEPRALAAIREGSCILEGPTTPPHLFTIGPVVDSTAGVDRHESLEWLESQPANGSVVFLCFGSGGIFSSTQLKEMATGLEKSGVRFLWVVRPPLAADTANFSFDSFLPKGFLERTKDRGLVVKSWAPQVDVLRHGSVGGFVSHCGWNSILEALSAEVPIVTWPLYAEQNVNRAYLVDEAKIAIRLTESEQGFVSADELETRLTELMSSDKGNELRKNVAAMRDAVFAATTDGGTSRNNLAKLAEIFKQNY